ncbi:hypothetical protein [Verrucomicrobium spinosum]|uniref:hypothetical protein n=1 Tax=Verrucomicrobium spinosum TaxID=2736 RepID=UPI0012E26E14|nr:hypothetical protein [Verrucomicrobium spinosum]
MTNKCMLLSVVAIAALCSCDAKHPSPLGGVGSNGAENKPSLTLQFADLASVTREVDEGYDEDRFAKVFGVGINLPDSKNNAESGLNTVLFRPQGQLGLKALLFKLKEGKIVAIDYSLSSLDGQSESRRQEILSGFEKRGAKRVPTLDGEFNVVDVEVDEYRSSEKGLVAFSMEANSVVRIIVYNPLHLRSEQVLPSVNNLHPEVVQKARELLERRKGIVKQTEGVR